MEDLKKCPLCGGERVGEVFEQRDLLVSLKFFAVWGCGECGLFFTNPRPADHEISQYYQSPEYISHNDKRGGVLSLAYRIVRWAMIRYKIKIIQKALGDRFKPRTLDYGCGTGEFLSVAAKMGWGVSGIEPNAIARNAAQSKGLPVSSNIMELDPLVGHQQFDVITMWHVLEHIHEPQKIISTLKGILAENGIIVVAVPEHKSYDAHYYRERWAAWDVPRHIFHYDSKSMGAMMKEQGLGLLSIHPLLFDAFYISIESEGKPMGFLKIARAIAIGLISNLFAAVGKHPFSSQIYIFKKIS